jgi:ABC-2 type transport system permease protein
MRWLSVITVLVMAFALTSLSVGLGALTPNFKEDNPARIANGLGGTMNVILSLIYIGATIAWLMIPAYHYAIGNQEMLDRLRPWVLPYLAGGLLLQAVTITLPMILGLRKWNRMEF